MPTKKKPAKKKAQPMEPTEPPPVALQPETKPEPIKIILDETRHKLYEGRSIGISHAFLKQTGPFEFTAVQPLSPCKDYLNDVVYSEKTGRPYRRYGLDTKKMDIFKDYAYLANASCGHKGQPPVASEVELLKTNLPNIQKVLNDIEVLLKIGKTELISINDNLVLSKLDLAWVSSTWAISLWGLMFRNALWSNGGDPFEELAASKDGEDQGYMAIAIPKLKRFIENGKLPVQEDPSYPHDKGICDCPMPPATPTLIT